MKILVWQWGRYGAGPRFAAELARFFGSVAGTEAALSLSASAEILHGADPPACDLPFRTYDSVLGFIGRLASAPALRPGLARRVRALRADVALCAMPGPLDGLMASALRRLGIPVFVVVHDADPHPGDGFPFQMALQRRLVRRADGLVALSTHVADRLREQGRVAGRPLLLASLPPLVFGPPPAPPRAHGGPLRLLSFGRLRPYKGLDLLAEGLARLGASADLVVRVVGAGPESAALDGLRRLPGVTVENRWVPEGEVGALIGWSDALVLSHREASQSGVAAAAIAARRWVIATRVGGLSEQLRDEKLALLCEPTAESLAATIDRLRVMTADTPAPPSDTQAQWKRVAEQLVAEMAALQPG